MFRVLVTAHTKYSRLKIGTEFQHIKHSGLKGHLACSQDGVLWYHLLPSEVTPVGTELARPLQVKASEEDVKWLR